VVTALERYFGTDEVAISLNSTVAGLTSSTHDYEHLSDILDETGDARVWAGVHFRHTMQVSEKLGKTVAKHALRHQFRPLRDDADAESLPTRHSGEVPFTRFADRGSNAVAGAPQLQAGTD
jgi:hypothetical protein